MEVGQIIHVFGEQAMDEALLEEIKLTLEHEMKEWNLLPLPREKTPITVKEYFSLPTEKRPLITLTVCFDMGWQK
eukprot:9091426-Ditylum_brightwellii.AAC.1